MTNTWKSTGQVPRGAVLGQNEDNNSYLFRRQPSPIHTEGSTLQSSGQRQGSGPKGVPTTVRQRPSRACHTAYAARQWPRVRATRRGLFPRGGHTPPQDRGLEGVLSHSRGRSDSPRHTSSNTRHRSDHLARVAQRERNVSVASRASPSCTIRYRTPCTTTRVHCTPPHTCSEGAVTADERRRRYTTATSNTAHAQRDITAAMPTDCAR